MAYKNVEDRRWCDALSKRRRVARLRAECLTLLGGQCIKCGFSDERALCIDHVNGGGRYERRHTNNITYLRGILESIKAKENKYQCLCANCNSIKAVELKERTPKQLY